MAAYVYSTMIPYESDGNYQSVLSFDGSIIAVSNSSQDTDTTTNAGFVDTYSYDVNLDEALLDFTFNGTTDEQFYGSVFDMSGDGQYLCIGAPAVNPNDSTIDIYELSTGTLFGSITETDASIGNSVNIVDQQVDSLVVMAGYTDINTFDNSVATYEITSNSSIKIDSVTSTKLGFGTRTDIIPPTDDQNGLAIIASPSDNFDFGSTDIYVLSSDYEFVSGATEIQKGDEGSYSGISVSTATDGVDSNTNIIVIGEPGGTLENDGNDFNQIIVKIYNPDEDVVEFTQITGENIGGLLGFSTITTPSFSNIIAAGAPGEDSGRGRVHLYHLDVKEDPSTVEELQVIDNGERASLPSDANFGRHVSMSGDGSILTVCHNRGVFIYKRVEEPMDKTLEYWRIVLEGRKC